jgi:hypothetical protein
VILPGIALVTLLAASTPDAAPAASDGPAAVAPDRPEVRNQAYLGAGLGPGALFEGNGAAGTAVRLRFGLARSPRLMFGLEGGYLEAQSRHVSFYDIGATFFPWERFFFVRGALGLSVINRPGWVGSPGTPTAALISETSQGPNALLGLGCAFGGRPGLSLSLNLELQHHLTSPVTGTYGREGLTTATAWLGLDWY